jgi:hypothetical protein
VFNCCEDDAIDAVTMVTTTLSFEQAQLHASAQCCCPHTGEVKSCDA